MRFPELVQRIEERLTALGLSDRKASMKAGLNPDGIRNIKRGRAPRAGSLNQLAKVLQVPASHLLDVADEIEPEDEGDETHSSEIDAAPAGYVGVPRLKIRGGLGGPGFDDSDIMGEPEFLPEPLIRGELRGAPLDFLFGNVEGQSMEPVLADGDRILIDRRQTNPSQPGVFWVHDGFGFVAKWIERVPKSDPPQYRIFSENARFTEYNVLTDEARIIGRIVWYARRL